MVNQTATMTIVPKREFWIDLLRAFACVMVLFCHSPQPYHGQAGQWLMPVTNYFGMAWGPILFFMISGACIMNKELEAVPFLRRRFSRILIPTIFWSIVYVIIECMVWHTCPEQDLWKKIIMIPFEPQYGLMWFMYALIAIYLMTPILSRWLHRCGQSECRLYITLWGITLLLPYADLLGIDIESIINSNGTLFYFSGFLWMAVLGYYCRQYGQILCFRWWYVLVCIIILMSPMYIFIIKINTGITVASSLSVDAVATTVLAFIFFRNLKWKGGIISKAIELLSKYSFGIYLTHMLLMYPFRMWIAQFNFHYFIQIPLTVLVVGLFAFSFTSLLSKIPFSKYIIG